MLIGSKPISRAAAASTATWSAPARRTSLWTGSMIRGPGPLPAVVPSMTQKIPGWISFWMASRSTSVSWMRVWVWWRLWLSRPPKAFFIAPVVVV